VGWADVAAVQVGRHVKRLTPLTGQGSDGGERMELYRGKVTRRRGKEGVKQGRGHGPLAEEVGFYLDNFV